MVQHGGRYAAHTNKKGRRIPGLAEDLTAKGSKFGLDDALLSALVDARPEEHAAMDQMLREHMAQFIRPHGKGGAKDSKDAEGFLKALYNAGYLTGTLEAQTGPGVRTATDAAYTLWGRGREIEPGRKTTFEDVAGSQGEFAPVTMEKATHDHNPLIMAERNRRIGNVFKHILAAAKAGDMIVARGGYDLSRLGRAIQELLDKQLAGIDDVDELEASEGRIKVEVITFLATYHGEQ
jgi:hypothetical protein